MDTNFVVVMGTVQITKELHRSLPVSVRPRNLRRVSVRPRSLRRVNVRPRSLHRVSVRPRSLHRVKVGPRSLVLDALGEEDGL